ncbi:hypothetical protein M513_08614, partial [Trichuris suis]
MAFKVTVKTLDGRDVPFELGEEDTIEDLKMAIERDMNIVIERQRIIFHGRVLTDDETVAGLGLNGQVVHLVERQACPPQPPRPTSEQHRPQQTRREAPAEGERNRLYAGTVVLPMPPMSLEEVQNTVRRVLEQYGEIGQGINFTAVEHTDPRRYELSVTLDGNMLTIDSPAFERIIYLDDTFRFMRDLLNRIETLNRASPSNRTDLMQQTQSTSTNRIDTEVEGLLDDQASKTPSANRSPQFPPLENLSSTSRIRYVDQYRTRATDRCDKALVNIVYSLPCAADDTYFSTSTDNHNRLKEEMKRFDFIHYAPIPKWPLAILDQARRFLAFWAVLSPPLCLTPDILGLRNAIQSDLYNMTQQALDLHQRIQPFIETMLTFLPTHESLLGPGVTLYIDHVQRVLHLYSHLLHVLTDLRMLPDLGPRDIVHPLVADRELAVRWANVSIVLGDRRSPAPPQTEGSRVGAQTGEQTSGTAPIVSTRSVSARHAGTDEDDSNEQRPSAGVSSTSLPSGTRPTTIRPRAIHNFLESIMSAIVGRRNSSSSEEGAVLTGASGDPRTNETQRRRRSGAEHISRHFNLLGPAIARVPVGDPRVGRRPLGTFTALSTDVSNNVLSTGRIGREGQGHQADFFDFGRPRHGSEPFLDCSSPHCSLTPPYGQSSRRMSNFRVGRRGRTESGETASDGLEASLDHIFRVIIDSMLYNMQNRPMEPPTGPMRAFIRAEPTFYSVSINATVQELPEGDGSVDSRVPTLAVQSAPADLGRWNVVSQHTATTAPAASSPITSSESLANLLRCVVFMSFFGAEGETHAQGIFSTILYALGRTGLEELAARNFHALDHRRESIRRYLVDNVLNGVEHPTDTQILDAAGMLRSDLGCIRQGILFRSACEGSSELMLLDRQELIQTEKILKFCLSHRNNDGFGRGLCDVLTTAVFEVFKLIVMSGVDGDSFNAVPPRDMHDRINNFFQMYCHDPVDRIVNRFREFARGFLAMYVSSSERYGVNSDHGNDGVTVSSEGNERDSVLSQSNLSSQAQPGQAQAHKRNVSSTVPPIIDRAGNDPGAMIFHLHDELPPPLMSVVEEDILRQQGMPPQPPFTEAYISGMPAKRRRVEVMEENRPHLANNAGDLLREALHRGISEMYEGVVSSAQGDTIDEAVASEVLNDVFYQFLRERIQRRLRFDQDFDRLRFPFSEKYFEPSSKFFIERMETQSGSMENRLLPEVETFERQGWRFTAVRHKAILPSTCFCGKNQPVCVYCHYDEQLKITVLPEMIFFKNSLQIEHQSGARIEFNPLDALREVPQTAITGYCVAATEVWTKARSQCLSNKTATANYDWTFSSSYKGTYSKLVASVSTESIDYNSLRIREPIEFYQSFPLYEDELSDHGCSMMDLKCRCMPSGFFVLLRLYLRIDKVVVRVLECRLHWRFANNYGLREYTLKEKSFRDLNGTERAAIMKIDEISSLLEPVVISRERVDFCES